MDNRPIGIFDSGVGGLTVLREIIKVVPNENTIYFGDTERVPYGPRDLSEVRKFAINITRFLHEKNVKLIVIACNTSTAAALDEIRKEYDIPIIGVIEPGARTAVFNTINKRVGVIATQGTVKSKAYEDEIKKASHKMAHTTAVYLYLDDLEVSEKLIKSPFKFLNSRFSTEIRNRFGADFYPAVAKHLHDFVLGKNNSIISQGKVKAWGTVVDAFSG